MVGNGHGRIDNDHEEDTQTYEIPGGTLYQCMFKIADANESEDGQEEAVLFGELPEELHYFRRSL
jgi:hypothetical protein